MTIKIEDITNYFKKYLDRFYDLFIENYYNNLDLEDQEKLKDLTTNNLNLTLINDLLIDYSEKELTDEELIDFLKNNLSEKYIQLPILKYLLHSPNQVLSQETTYILGEIFIHGDFPSIISGKRKISLQKNYLLELAKILKEEEYEIEENLLKELTNYLKKLESKIMRQELGITLNHNLTMLIRELHVAKKLQKEPTFYNDLESLLNAKLKNHKNYYLKYQEIIKSLSKTNKKDKTIYLYLLSNLPYKLFKESFEDHFNNLYLTKEDLINYIEERETTNKKVSIDLIYSYEASYYLKHNCEKEVKKLKQNIKTSYKTYKKEHFYYSTADFITYYNEKENKDLRHLILSNKKTPLTKEILTSVLLDVPYILLNDLKDTTMVKESWLTELDIAEEIVAESEKIRKQRIYDLYNEKITDLKNRNDVTKEYFILNNIPEVDREGFEELIAWYLKNKKSYFNQSYNSKDKKVKLRNKDLVLKDFLTELENTPYNNRHLVKEKYLNLISSYNLEDTLEKQDFLNVLTTYEETYFEKNSLNIFRYLLVNTNNNLYKVYKESEFSSLDINLLFKKLKTTHKNLLTEITSLEKKYFLDKKHFKESLTEETSPYKEDLSEEILISYLNYQGESLKSFLKENALTELILYSALGVIKNTNQTLFNNCLEKLDKKRYNIFLNTLKEVVTNLENFDYTYFDYRLKFKKLKPQDLYILALNNNLVTPKNKTILKRFAKQNQNQPKFKENDLLLERHFLLIDGKKVEIKEETKIEIINLLKDLKLPKEKVLYNHLLKMKLENSTKFKELTKQL